MPRMYTTEEKRHALRRLAANNGSAMLAHKETGIPESTLYNWWQERKAMSDADRLRELRQQLIAESLEMATGLSVKAPLNQRSTALNQMIDKILKITTVLEEDKTDDAQTQEPILRVEFIDENGQAHDTPYGSDADSAE